VKRKHGIFSGNKYAAKNALTYLADVEIIEVLQNVQFIRASFERSMCLFVTGILTRIPRSFTLMSSFI